MAEPVKVYVFFSPLTKSKVVIILIRMVIGSVLGQIRPFVDKVKALDEKYGPFGFVICTGDFFVDGDEDGADELLNGSIPSTSLELYEFLLTCPVPKTTYIMGGSSKIPAKVQEKADRTGGELAPNLLLLGKAAVITTSQGIRIAALGGVYDPASYSSPKYASNPDPN